MSRKEFQYKDNVEFIHAIAKNISSIVKELDDPYREFFFDIDGKKRVLPETEFGRSVVTIINFTLISDTTWGLVYNSDDDNRME